MGISDNDRYLIIQDNFPLNNEQNEVGLYESNIF